MKTVLAARKNLTAHAVAGAYALLILFFTILFLRYSFGGFMELFNSDSAANVLFAQEMIAQHTPFPQWNDSTWIFFPAIIPNLAVMPLVLAFVGDWFTAFRIAATIDQIVMLGLMWWLLGRTGLSVVARLFLIAFLLIGPSLPFVWQTTLLAFKSWLFVFILLLGYFALRLIDAETTRMGRRWAGLLTAISALLFVDLANAATILPGLGAGLAAMWLADTDRASRARCLIAGASLLVACVLGQLIKHFVLTGSHYTPFALGFTDLVESGGHLQLFVRGMIELFGAVPPAGTSPYSVSGAASGAKFMLLLAVLVAPLYFTLRYHLLQSRYARLLAVTCTISLAVRLYVYLFTGISVGITGTARYFIVEVLLGITVCLFYLEQRIGERRVAELVVLGMILPFALTSPLRTRLHPISSKDQILASQLAANGLDLGYATFWNANAPTAISSGKIRVRPVDLADATIQPRRWLSSDRWYRGNPAARQSFLLLDAQELKAADLSGLRAAVGDPAHRVDIGYGFTALVYPFDLAERLDWGHRVHAPASN
jgi:hypothetical protein